MFDKRLFRRFLPAVIFCAALLAFPSESVGRWYKGNTHAHSLWSDGDEFAEMAADWYKNQGYDFLCISDHDCLLRGEKWRVGGDGWNQAREDAIKRCRGRFGDDWLQISEKDGKRRVKLKTFDEIAAALSEPGRFLLIEGDEVSARPYVHVNVLNLAEPIGQSGEKEVGKAVAATFAAAREQAEKLGRPLHVTLNHPNAWGIISPEDVAGVEGLRFLEICNGGSGGEGPRHYGTDTHPGVEKFWDIANTIRVDRMKAPPLYGLASDDAHHYHEFAPGKCNPGRAWIMVRADELTPEALFKSMQRGDFYATTGVILKDLSFNAERGTLEVRARAEPGVRYTIEFIGTLEGTDSAGTPVPSVTPPGQKPWRPGKIYSPEVGKVLARSDGPSAAYRFRGNELFVRAVVRSDKPISNAPAGEAQNQEAWCQPVIRIKRINTKN